MTDLLRLHFGYQPHPPPLHCYLGVARPPPQFVSAFGFDCPHNQISLVYASHSTTVPPIDLRSTLFSPAHLDATRRFSRLTTCTTPFKMDSDLDSVVFDDFQEDESEGYSDPVSAAFLQWSRTKANKCTARAF